MDVLLLNTFKTEVSKKTRTSKRKGLELGLKLNSTLLNELL